MIAGTPKGMRLHIGIFGRRNVGKSSLLNALTRQQVSIVSAVAGTTTDPVEKRMELLPLGPVLFIDTAGIDDEGALGQQRIERTRQVFERADLAIIVAAAGEWGAFEAGLLAEMRARKVPTIVVFNKHDIARPTSDLIAQLAQELSPAKRSAIVALTATSGAGIHELRQALIDNVPEGFLDQRPLVGDLVPPGSMTVLVVPIDMEAPRGRLILPQVQAIRDLLDHDAQCLVVKERELRAALDNLKSPPALVVTDSQAFLRVAADVPASVGLTSFSILFARYKGDLGEYVRGVAAIDRLAPGDGVLMAEACSHHPIGDDIGRVKIPRWLTQYTGCDLAITHHQGHDFPGDLRPYKLVIHCGSCTFNRREVMSRIERCRHQGVPITNYGITIAATLGILQRALAPFGFDRLQAE